MEPPLHSKRVLKEYVLKEEQLAKQHGETTESASNPFAGEMAAACCLLPRERDELVVGRGNASNAHHLEEHGVDLLSSWGNTKQAREGFEETTLTCCNIPSRSNHGVHGFCSLPKTLHDMRAGAPKTILKDPSRSPLASCPTGPELRCSKCFWARSAQCNQNTPAFTSA